MIIIAVAEDGFKGTFVRKKVCNLSPLLNSLKHNKIMYNKRRLAGIFEGEGRNSFPFVGKFN
jgi:hypothetical protein